MILDYYPLGMTHKGYNNVVSSNSNSAASKYKYNGKEFNEELGLDWYDFGARNYDASLGRWMNLDPLAEKYMDNSPYNSVLNNPVFFVDPNGKEVDVSDLVNGNSETDTWLLIQLMANLSATSGRTIEINTDNKSGKSTLFAGECKDGCSSKKAAGYVDYLLSDTSGTVKVMNNDRNDRKDSNGNPAKAGGSQAYANGEIYLDAKQINNIQKSMESNKVDSRSMDTGFVFLHETLHTRFGAGYFNRAEDNKQKTSGIFRDPQSGFGQTISAGPVVDRINKFRQDMGLPTRTTYGSYNAGSLSFHAEGKPVDVKIENHNLE